LPLGALHLPRPIIAGGVERPTAKRSPEVFGEAVGKLRNAEDGDRSGEGWDMMGRTDVNRLFCG